MTQTQLKIMGLVKNFLARTPKTWSRKEKEKLVFNKMKNAGIGKDFANSVKGKHILGENIFKSHIW